MNLDPGVKQRLHLVANVGAMFIHAQQISAHFKIGCVDRNILRRQSLLDDALQFIVSQRSQRGVVAVKKREPNVFVANEK